MSDEASKINPLKSSVYHHKVKGCQISTFPFFRIIKTTKWIVEQRYYKAIDLKIWYQGAKCKTHNVRLCYANRCCYWERGGHYGNLSEGYELN